MATIENSVQMFNGMSTGLRSVTSSLSIAISSFEEMARASCNCFDVSSIQAGRMELTQTEVVYNRIEEAIREVDQQQQTVNSSISKGTGVASGLNKMFSGLGGDINIQKIFAVSDAIATSTASLSGMAGGLENVKAVQNEFYQAAQRTRTSYLGTMDTVAKLGLGAGNVFKNSGETISFVEQLNKQFKIAGTSQQGIYSATSQLEEVFGSGTMSGNQFDALNSAAPTVMQSVADYMNLPIDKLQEMASKGQITSDIVKNAMFAMAEETNAKFNGTPTTWAEVWTMCVSKVIKVAQPLLGLIGGLADNWNVIEPLILGVAAALGIYLGYLGILNTEQAIHNGLQAISAARTVIKSGLTLADAAATTTATGAQVGLNAAILASPITWIIVIIIALIAALFAVVAWINKVQGTSISALGLICGAIAFAGAFILNVLIGIANAGIQYLWSRFVEPIIGIVEWVLNVFNGGFNSFGGAVANLIGQIISWFLSLGKIVTKIIDAIFGTNWTDGLSSVQDGILKWGKNETAVTFEHSVPQINRIGYGDAFDAGNKFGTGIEDKLSSIFGGVEDANSLYESDDYENLLNNTADTAINTGNMAGTMEVSDQNLKYMRDAAEMEAINRYTTAQISVDFKNTATINSDMDIDGVINKFTEKLRESVDTCAEEVHYIV